MDSRSCFRRSPRTKRCNRPNHALQRTEAGGGLFLAFHVLFRQPLSLSLDSLGARSPRCVGGGTLVPRRLLVAVSLPGSLFASVSLARRQRPSFTRRWEVLCPVVQPSPVTRLTTRSSGRGGRRAFLCIPALLSPSPPLSLSSLGPGNFARLNAWRASVFPFFCRHGSRFGEPVPSFVRSHS